MKVYLAADHAGFKLKERLKEFLKLNGHNVGDYGAYELNPADDYPDIIFPMALEVAKDPESMGIAIGFSGEGEAIAANQVPGIRAVVYYGKPAKISEIGKEREDKPKDIIVLSREDNNANVLAIGAGFVGPEEAIEVVEKWLKTLFGSEERHVRRLKKIADMRAKINGKQI